MASKLKYCQKKAGNSGSCACLATHEVILITKKNQTNGERRKEFRCDKHKNSGTTKKTVIEICAFDQTEAIKNVFLFLNSFIGKPVRSTYHPVTFNYPFIGKYCKENGGIMCLNEYTKKWKFVYHYQLV